MKGWVLSRHGMAVSALAIAACLQPATAAAQSDPVPGAPSQAQPAQAQSTRGTATPNEGSVPDIVVTATRSATNLQRTPLAITAVTADALTQRAITSVQEVAAIVPNASFNTASSNFGRSVQAYIRGVGQADFNLAFEPGVAFYVDDQYYALIVGSTFDLLDLERVEVLRGPQGTVFGRNAIGGAVNLIPKSPNGEPGGYAEATYGRFNRIDIRAGFNVPLADNLFLRVSGVSKSRRGYQKLLDFRCEMVRQGTPQLAGTLPTLLPNITPTVGGGQEQCVAGRYGGEDVKALRGALRLQQGIADITLSADYTNDESQVAADKTISIVDPASPGTNPITALAINLLNSRIYQPLFGISYDRRFLTSSPFTTYANFSNPITPATIIPGTYYTGAANRGGERIDPHSEVRNYGFAGKGIFDLGGGFTATLLSSYRHLTTSAPAHNGGAPFVAGQIVNTVLGYDQVTAEPRLNYDSDLIDATAGAFYYHGNGRSTAFFHLGTFDALLPTQINTAEDVKSESKAVYAQAVIRPIARLSATLGVRYSRDTKDAYFNDGTTNKTVIIRGDSVDYRLGLNYQLTERLLVYGSVSTGYKPGAFNPRPYQPSQFRAIGGERVTAYELGFKSDLFDRKVRFNLAGFYSDYSKRVGSTGSTSECIDDGTPGRCILVNGAPLGFVPAIVYVNSPAKVKGIEAEVSARPLTGLSLDGSLGYTDFDDKLLKNTPGLFTTSVPYVPRWTGSAGIQYEVPTPALDGSITPRLDAFYQSRIAYANNVPAAVEPGRVTFNGRITYANEPHGFQLSVGATNLFDKRYFYNIFDLTATLGATTEGQPGRPREWYVQLRKTF